MNLFPYNNSKAPLSKALIIAVSNVIHKKQNTTKVKMPKIYDHFLILVPPNKENLG